MGSQTSREVGQVLAETVSLPLVEYRRGVRSDIGPTGGVHELRRQHGTVQRFRGRERRSIPGAIGIVGVAVNILETDWKATILIILIEVSEPRGQNQAGSYRDIGARVVQQVGSDITDAAVVDIRAIG